MAVETELKLELDAIQVARLRRHPLWRQAQSVATRKLHSIYYDTPELDLWRAGVALRVRRVGRQWVQTIKSGGRVVAGLHEREETEHAVRTSQPDFSVLSGEALIAPLAVPGLLERLQPVFITDFSRASRILKPAPDVVIEASIDRGHITNGRDTEPLCELELEVKTGPAWRAFQVALHLLESIPMRIEQRSKAERGFAIALAQPKVPRKTARSPVTAVMSGNEAFAALVQSCLQHYAVNQRGMLAGGDIEYLHQMRVALRRLRCVLDTYAPLLGEAQLQQPVGELRWLAGMLGQARDWDVFHAEVLPSIVARYPAHAGMVSLARVAAQLRHTANRNARLAVTSMRGQGLLLKLAGWCSAQTWRETLTAAQRNDLDRPVRDWAQAVLAARQRKVRKRGRHFGSLTPEGLHRLRIAAKKLRYGIEFFASLYDDGRAQRLRLILGALQDALGANNDAVTVAQLAVRATRNLSGPSADEARGILFGWSAGLQDAGARGLHGVWKEYLAAKEFWD